MTAAFTEPLDAPYMADLIQRRGVAIPDGLMTWGHCMFGIAGELPPNFGDVVTKLQEAAGITSAAWEAFSAAQKVWLAEWEAQEHAHVPSCRLCAVARGDCD